ncbi:McrC family protein [Clavibacter michiganensis]|uniref:McrC family protein n=1 Tax=Clavibacter michiganensis TaxID=28447 RepID=UPI001BE0278E|nr:McrC family protein [Clavibacter michiganensis]MBT1636778.1 McrC family protein [Clavibacter michiganensis]
MIEVACATGLVESRTVRGNAQLKPRLNRVGAVSVGGNELIVVPKAPFSSVLFMLAYARDPGFRPDEVSGVGAALFPAIAETYARLMERALGRGVLQGYRRIDESALTVRGRIRFSDQIARRGGQVLPIELTVDEYTTDIAENQILRAGARVLLAMPRVTDGSRRRLVHLESRLAEVSVLPSGGVVPAWQPSRLNSRYHSALRFAESILRRIAPSTTGDGRPVASFVVDMGKAFEGFVTAALSASFADGSGGVSTAQYVTRLDEERTQTIRPDFVHGDGGEPRIVVDAKYKTGAAPVEDLYQMLAYCTVLALGEGTLVYVADRDHAQSRVSTVRGAGIRIRIVRVDVSVPPEQMLSQVGGLRSELERTGPVATAPSAP